MFGSLPTRVPLLFSVQSIIYDTLFAGLDFGPSLPSSSSYCFVALLLSREVITDSFTFSKMELLHMAIIRIYSEFRDTLSLLLCSFTWQ